MVLMQCGAAVAVVLLMQKRSHQRTIVQGCSRLRGDDHTRVCARAPARCKRSGCTCSRIGTPPATRRTQRVRSTANPPDACRRPADPCRLSAALLRLPPSGGGYVASRHWQWDHSRCSHPTCHRQLSHRVAVDLCPCRRPCHSCRRPCRRPSHRPWRPTTSLGGAMSARGASMWRSSPCRTYARVTTRQSRIATVGEVTAEQSVSNLRSGGRSAAITRARGELTNTPLCSAFSMLSARCTCAPRRVVTES